MIPALMVVCFSFTLPAPAQYSGDSGTAEDPYQIATAADLTALGETPDDYDQHFILTADIDLDPNLPGRKVFDGAVIAADTNDATPCFNGFLFTGAFDGDGHTISHLTIAGVGFLGVFGGLAHGAEVSNLGLEAVDVNGTSDSIGGLVGLNYGCIDTCYCTGRVSGRRWVGGLASENYDCISTCNSADSVTGEYSVGGLVGSSGCYELPDEAGTRSITEGHSTATVNGGGCVGGLVGPNNAHIATSYSIGSVTGGSLVGGLAGENYCGAIIHRSYSAGTVNGDGRVGGLVGENYDAGIRNCYSAGPVRGSRMVGGLVGYGWGDTAHISSSFWDVETSGATVGYGLSEDDPSGTATNV